MANSIYIAGIDAGTGKSLVTLGLMSILSQHFKRCGFFKAIVHSVGGKNDPYLELIQKNFLPTFQTEELFGLDQIAAEKLLAAGKESELYDQALTRFKKLETQSDFVLVEGTDYQEGGTPTEFATNARIANNLGCQILLVANAKNRSETQVIQQIETAVSALKDLHSEIIGIIVNRVSAADEQSLKTCLLQSFSKQFSVIHTITERRQLAEPTVGDIAQYLGAKIICGQAQISRTVSGYSIAAKHVGGYLNAEKDRKNFLVITPGDRTDILLGSILADQSQHYPKIAGILLTTGDLPKQTVMDILEGLDQPFPVLSCQQTTFEASNQLSRATFHTHLQQPEKCQAIIEHFQAELNVNQLIENITESKSLIVTPQMFSYRLIEKARMQKRHIVLPEGEDPRILIAANFLLKRNIVDLTLLGDEKTISKIANREDLDLSAARIIDPKNAPEFHQKYADKYFELRQHKQVNSTIAHDRMLEVTYFGTMMVYFGDADGMVSGASHTTGETIKPALEVIKTRPDMNKVSSIFLMCLADRVVAYGDCAINPTPDAETLAEIALASAQTALKFGIDPRVAMLSYSSGSSGVGKSVERVRAATQIAREKQPGLLIEGPIQYDAAVDQTVAEKKMPGSVVAGRATVLIFPDLNTGNNTYKAVQRETGAVAIGPVLQGLNKPVNDLSRGCTVADIINTVVITAIQAQTESV